MASPPPECVSLSVIHHSPADFPWYPAAAVSCGRYGGIEYFRQGTLSSPSSPPPPPPRPPAPPTQPPSDCVSVVMIHHSPADFPWWPAQADECGTFGGVAYYRYDPSKPTERPPDSEPADDGASSSGGTQPVDDVDADEDPDAYEPGEPPEADEDPDAVLTADDATGDV